MCSLLGEFLPSSSNGGLRPSGAPTCAGVAVALQSVGAFAAGNELLIAAVPPQDILQEHRDVMPATRLTGGGNTSQQLLGKGRLPLEVSDFPVQLLAAPGEVSVPDLAHFLKSIELEAIFEPDNTGPDRRKSPWSGRCGPVAVHRSHAPVAVAAGRGPSYLTPDLTKKKGGRKK